MVRELMDKIMLLLGLVGPGMEEKMNGRPCHDRTAPQRGAQVAAAPHPHGRIRNPHLTNYGGMAREERLPEGQLGREHGSRHKNARKVFELVARWASQSAVTSAWALSS